MYNFFRVNPDILFESFLEILNYQNCPKFIQVKVSMLLSQALMLPNGVHALLSRAFDFKKEGNFSKIIIPRVFAYHFFHQFLNSSLKLL